MKYILLFFFSFLFRVTTNAQSSQDTITSKIIDSSEFYGLIPQRPIKVGGTFMTGVANQRKYLESLRDAQGKSVSYERKGSCCAYPTENGFKVMAC